MSSFQAIINLDINPETHKVTMKSGFVRAVKGTGKSFKAKPKVIKKESTMEAEDVEVVEW